MFCRRCKSENAVHEWHDVRMTYLTRCYDCNAVTWQPKEHSKNRESKHSNLVKKFGIEYCQWCMRKKDEIPPPSTLEAHHIIEYAEGGTDEKDNILILCTACHKKCHHDRTYYGHYKNINDGKKGV